MILSPDTQAVLDFLDEYYKRSMRKTEDVGVILEVCASNGFAAYLNLLLTKSKIVWNLYRKSRSIANTSNPIAKELDNQVDLMRQCLIVIFTEQDDRELENNYKEKYTDQNFVNRFNLLDLAHDLSLIKELQTMNREGSLFDKSEPQQ